MSKYRNIKSVDEFGNKFDSQLERRRWVELKIMHSGGLIRNLSRQYVFQLVVGNHLICKYVADHMYERDGKRVVEDVKGGVKTAVYQLKKKLMKALYGVDIYEWPEKPKRKRRKLCTE